MSVVPLSTREPPAVLRRRLLVLLVFVLCVFAGLVVRLWMLQVGRGETMRTLSDENRIRLYRVRATRGIVRDRLGRIIVDNRASFDAVLVPEDAPDLANTIENLSQFLHQSSAETQALLERARERPKFQEVTLRRDLAWEEVVAIETHRLELPGVTLRTTPRRSYPFGSTLAHLIGYVGEINATELERDSSYRMGDLIGKAGLERRWEPYLRGKDGGEQVEVDALGRKLRVLHEVGAAPGDTLTLTVDLDLQQVAEEAFVDKEGVLVALDPRNGELLALVSQPMYDPNVFARGIKPEEWRALREDPRNPLHNRAVQGQYPPASVFKIVMAAAALEEGVINPFSRVHCGGGMQFGNRYFRCWKRGGHGTMDLHEALVQSCDVYFYQVGQRVGIDLIAEWARKLGLGGPTGVGLDHEKSGIIPDSAWKKRRFGEPWYPGDTVSASIGQGYVTVTPMQMAMMVSAIAAGELYKPHFVKSVKNVDGEVVFEAEPETAGPIGLKRTTLAQIRDALRDVVEAPHGTGKRARVEGVEVAGKTGTAQVVGKSKRDSGSGGPAHHRDHAWFASYAPADQPEVALVVLVEHAEGGGGAIAAPIAQQFLSTYFRLKRERAGVQYADVRPAVAGSF